MKETQPLATRRRSLMKKKKRDCQRCACPYLPFPRRTQTGLPCRAQDGPSCGNAPRSQWARRRPFRFLWRFFFFPFSSEMSSLQSSASSVPSLAGRCVAITGGGMRRKARCSRCFEGELIFRLLLQAAMSASGWPWPFCRGPMPPAPSFCSTWRLPRQQPGTTAFAMCVRAGKKKKKNSSISGAAGH